MLGEKKQKNKESALNKKKDFSSPIEPTDVDRYYILLHLKLFCPKCSALLWDSGIRGALPIPNGEVLSCTCGVRMSCDPHILREPGAAEYSPSLLIINGKPT